MEENRTVITTTTTTTTTTMYQLEAPVETTIVKRPSATCKTPYVADITIDTMDTLAHTPALGCCGLSDKGSIVVVTKLEAGKTKCSHRVELAKLETRWWKKATVRSCVLLYNEPT
jgi:DNA-binding sugar fermentation-stimulating protein